MKIGLALPIVDEGLGIPTWSRVSELAISLEAAGLDALWIPDHMVSRTPGMGEQGCQEAATTVAALAAVTSRIELGSLVFTTSFRSPTLLAKMAASIDAIAGGRFTLGLGCGWHEPEHKAFGFPFDHRVARFEEAVSIIRPLVRGERVTFRGRWNDVDDCVLLPSPLRPIPIHVAAHGPRMLELAARFGDGWNAAWFGRPTERFDRQLEAFHAACDVVGRDPATVEMSVGVEVDNGDAVDRTGVGEHLPPDPAAIADALAEWSHIGMAQVQVNSGPRNERLVDIVIEAISRFR